MGAHIYKYNFQDGSFYIGKNNGRYDRATNHAEQSEDFIMIGGIMFGNTNKHGKFYAKVREFGMPTKTILEDNIDLNVLDEREMYWINRYDAETKGLNGTGAARKSYRGMKVVFDLANNTSHKYKTNKEVELHTGIKGRRVSDLLNNVYASYETLKGNVYVVCKEDELMAYRELIIKHREDFINFSTKEKEKEVVPVAPTLNWLF